MEDNKYIALAKKMNYSPINIFLAECYLKDPINNSNDSKEYFELLRFLIRSAIFHQKEHDIAYEEIEKLEEEFGYEFDSDTPEAEYSVIYRKDDKQSLEFLYAVNKFPHTFPSINGVLKLIIKTPKGDIPIYSCDHLNSNILSHMTINLKRTKDTYIKDNNISPKLKINMRQLVYSKLKKWLENSPQLIPQMSDLCCELPDLDTINFVILIVFEDSSLCCFMWE